MEFTAFPNLFNRCGLKEHLSEKEQKLFDEIQSLSEEQIIQDSLEGLYDYFVDKYWVEPLKIDESEISTDQHDHPYVDIRENPLPYMAIDPNNRDTYYINGTRFLFILPFSGDENLFDCKPSTSTPLPEIVVGQPNRFIGIEQNKRNHLLFSYGLTVMDAPDVKSIFQRDLDVVRDYTGWIAEEVGQFNSTIREKAILVINGRREKLLKDREIFKNLDIRPIRRDLLPDYIPPLERRIVPKSPPEILEPYSQPVLVTEEYNYILSVISSMGIVIERMPQVFKGVSEEFLRALFLVQLNGHYEGGATGETFNGEGKTDILMREKGRNIFIAECKFWDGGKSLTEALDQLLSYTTWRDTKTALIIFNRNKSTTNVLKQIPEVVKEHKNYKIDLPYDSETGFQYTFGHSNDTNKELVLTILVFDVPSD